MKIMISFHSTEDYIIDCDTEEQAKEIVKNIWDFKQDSQKDLIKQHKIKYYLDVSSYSTVEEIEDLKLYDQYFED
jgi:hypothetical protein